MKDLTRHIRNQKRTNLNEANYKELLHKTLQYGKPSKDRTGIGTRVLTNQVLDIDMSEVPVVTGKKMFWKTAGKELKLFINGETDIKEYKKEGINYWDKFAFDDGSLGPIYGAQWRNFYGVDQLYDVIKSLKDNPTSRRHIISAWNPGEQHLMSLPPCPVMIQFNVVDGVLDALVIQRSADSFLGVPFDVYQYYLLTRYINGMSGMNYKLGKLTFMYGNFHIYENHIEQVNEYLKTRVYKAPTITDDLKDISWELHDYRSGKYIKGEINN